MTPDEFRAARLKIGLTQTELGKVLGYGRMHVTQMESGKKAVKTSTEIAMLALSAGWRPKDWPQRLS